MEWITLSHYSANKKQKALNLCNWRGMFGVMLAAAVAYVVWFFCHLPLFPLNFDKSVYLPVQYRGSSDLSPQSSIPSQYRSSLIHRPFRHGNSEIRHAGTAIAINSAAISTSDKLCKCCSMAFCTCETKWNTLKLFRTSATWKPVEKTEIGWERRRVMGERNGVDSGDVNPYPTNVENRVSS